MKWHNTAIRAIATILMLLMTTGCWKEDMGSQPKAKPMQDSKFFTDGATARPLVIGTVARGDLELDSHLYRGFVDGVPATTYPEHYPTPQDGPFPTNGPALASILRHGQEQFTIYCAMCHGDAGDGRGIIMQRGFVPPPNYNLDRLRIAPVGHVFDVITNGYGAMYGYGDRIAPADRWAIVAYFRTLQWSQGVPVDQLNAEQLQQLGAPQ
jgi:mono/diheme cytochrome c family protein